MVIFKLGVPGQRRQLYSLLLFVQTLQLVWVVVFMIEETLHLFRMFKIETIFRRLVESKVLRMLCTFRSLLYAWTLLELRG